VPFDPVNSSLSEYSLTSASGCSTLYFVRGINWNSNTGPVIAASNDIWQVEVTPDVDLNSDGIVDAGDMRIMIDYWHTNEPLCDIAPPPLGDRFVDVQDLIVLAEHLFEDYRLIAHWEMDEETGDIAHDSAGAYNATLQGQPTWQPMEGVAGGALRLHGIDDYVSTPFVLDPGDVSFSVTAWIRGGTPGQVIISQADDTVGRMVEPGSTLLGANSPDGKLMTALGGVNFGSLESEFVITDAQWHHVGLVYDRDGLRRHLYVDGTEVAQDTTPMAGAPSSGSLYIGAGQDLAPATFFSGLIDDVRIYNAALSTEEVEVLVQQATSE